MFHNNHYFKFNIKSNVNLLKIINNGSEASKHANFKDILSIELSAILSNKGFNYSLIYAEINNPDYLFLSNYSTDIKNTPSPSASIIKIYIMIALYTKISHGLLDSNTKITLQDSMKVGVSGILYSKDSYTKYSIDDLIYLMITEGDNTATNILIDLIGKDYINFKIKKLGCINTALNRKMMDITAFNLGIDNYTCVYDLYITFMKMLDNSCINEFYDNKMINILKDTKSTIKKLDTLTKFIK